MRRVVAPEQIAQRLGVGFGDGAQEAREAGLTIRGLRPRGTKRFSPRRAGTVLAVVTASSRSARTSRRSAALSPSSWTQRASMTLRSSSPSVPTVQKAASLHSVRYPRVYLYRLSDFR